MTSGAEEVGDLETGGICVRHSDIRRAAIETDDDELLSLVDNCDAVQASRLSGAVRVAKWLVRPACRSAVPRSLTSHQEMHFS